MDFRRNFFARNFDFRLKFWANFFYQVDCNKFFSEHLTVKTSPHLVNISSDPSLSGILIYLIPNGETLVGNSEDCQIKMEGNLIQSQHCRIKRDENGISIDPIGGETFVNGQLIKTPARLESGDRVVLSGTHYFAFNSGTEPGSKVNFDQAKSELLEAQRVEMERNYRQLVEKEKAEMQSEIERIKKGYAVDPIETDDVCPMDQSLLFFIEKISENLDQSDQSDVAFDTTHFDLNILIKEANQVAANGGCDDRIRFEPSMTKGMTLVKVTRDNQWVSFLPVEKFTQQLEEMKVTLVDDPDESLTTFILRSNDWEVIDHPADRSADKSSEKIRVRQRRMSKRVSLLAMRSGLDASMLEPPVEESLPAGLIQNSNILTLSSEERNKGDVVYQMLRTLEQLFGRLTQYDQTDADCITHFVLQLRYAAQFGFEDERYNSTELRLKIKKIRHNQSQIQDLIAKLFGGLDPEVAEDYLTHARQKILDMTKTMGAVVTLGTRELPSDCLSNNRLTKAFNQGQRSATEGHLFSILDKTAKLTQIELNEMVNDRAKIDQVENAVKTLVEEVSMAQNVLQEHSGPGLAGKRGLVGSLSPMVDAVAKVKQSSNVKERTASYRELKSACRNARMSVNTFESSVLTAGHRYETFFFRKFQNF